MRNYTVTASLMMVLFLWSCTELSHSKDPDLDVRKEIVGHPPGGGGYGCMYTQYISAKLNQMKPSSQSSKEHNMTLRFAVNSNYVSRYSMNLVGFEKDLSIGFVAVEEKIKVLSVLSSSSSLLEGGKKEYVFDLRVTNPPSFLPWIETEPNRFRYEVRLLGSLASFDEYPFDCPDVVFRERDNLEVTNNQ